jgi:hypothetical protein
MTRDEALERSIRQLLASTAEPPASKRKRVKRLPLVSELHERQVNRELQSEPILSRT